MLDCPFTRFLSHTNIGLTSMFLNQESLVEAILQSLKYSSNWKNLDSLREVCQDFVLHSLPVRGKCGMFIKSGFSVWRFYRGKLSGCIPACVRHVLLLSNYGTMHHQKSNCCFFKKFNHTGTTLIITLANTRHLVKFKWMFRYRVLRKMQTKLEVSNLKIPLCFMTIPFKWN